MRVFLLTQDEPFFLAESISHLLEVLPDHSSVVGCVLFPASPFGRRSSFTEKARETLSVFGWRFFLRYAAAFVLGRVDPRRSIPRVLKKYDIPVIRLEGSINSEESLGRIRSLEPDLLVSVAGNQIFKRPLIDLAPEGCLNLHTALLPRYRGLMPSFWVLRHGERETGVSVFFVDEGIDSGPIIVQRRVEIGEQTQQELIRTTKRVGMEAIAEAIDLIHRDEVRLLPNDDSEKSYFSFPTREDVEAFREAGKRFF